MLYLLDTNMVVYITKRVPPVIQVLKRKSPDDVAISIITLAELRFGACKSRFPEQTHLNLTRFLAPWQIVPFDETAAEIYGEIRFYLESRGTPIGERDMLIAAVALARKMIVVTHNLREYERVPDLQIEDWYRE